MRKFIVLSSIVFFLGFFQFAYGQTNAPSTYKPSEEMKYPKKRVKRSGKKNVTLAETKKAHRKRMKRMVREKSKMAREMEKPKYSDPSYFGHRRKPKKRPLGKRKLCRECNIVH